MVFVTSASAMGPDVVSTWVISRGTLECPRIIYTDLDPSFCKAIAGGIRHTDHLTPSVHLIGELTGPSSSSYA
jgi:hypothetical protein